MCLWTMPDWSEPWFTCIVKEITGNSYTIFMDTVITCPKCKTEIPLSDAFKHEIEAGVLAAERTRHQHELDAAVKSAEISAAKKADQEAAHREALLRAEAAGEKQRNAELRKQLADLFGE